MKFYKEKELLFYSLLTETDESELGLFLNFPLPGETVELLDEATHQTIKKQAPEIAIKIAFLNIYLHAVEEIIKSFSISSQKNGKSISGGEVDMGNAFSGEKRVGIAKKWFDVFRLEIKNDDSQALFAPPWDDFRLFVWGAIIMKETKSMLDQCHQALQNLCSSIVCRYAPEECSKAFYSEVINKCSPDTLFECANERILLKINHADSVLRNYIIKNSLLKGKK